MYKRHYRSCLRHINVCGRGACRLLSRVHIIKQLSLVFPVFYEGSEGDTIRLLKQNTVECVTILQRMSNTRERTITLDVEMEDYHRIKNRTEVTADGTE